MIDKIIKQIMELNHDQLVELMQFLDQLEGHQGSLTHESGQDQTNPERDQ